MKFVPHIRMAAWLAVLLLCMPAAASAESKTDVPVRVGSHQGYGRVVFDTPSRTDYQVTQQDQHVIVRFGAELKINPAPKPPHNVLNITTGAGEAKLTIAPGAAVRDWRFGDRIVIDVWDAGAAPPLKPQPVPATRVQQAVPATGSAAEAAQSSQAPPRKSDDLPPPPKAEPARAQPTAAPGPAPTQPAESPALDASDVPAPPAARPAAPAPSPPPVTEMPEQAKPKPDNALIVPIDPQTGLAMFRRSNVALIVFDQPRAINLESLQEDLVFSTASVQTLPTATVVRVVLDPTTALSASRQSDAWRIVAIRGEPKLQPVIPSATDGRLTLSVSGPGNVVSIADPDTGVTLLVGTQRREGQGVPILRRTAEFMLLPTWQGVAVEPSADTLTLRTTQDGFLLTGGSRGLTLSPPSDIAEQLAHAIGLTRQFDFPSQPSETLMQRLRRQVAQDAATPPLGRGPPRQEVARTMISLGFGAEAQSVLGIAAAEDPRIAASPENAALASIAAVLAFRPQEATGLADPRLAPADDLALWRAIRLAQLQEGSPRAAAVLAATLPLLLTYPAEMQDRVLPLVAETLVSGGEIAAATALLARRKDDATLDFARGMLQEAQGDWTGALRRYDRLSQSKDPLHHARAAVRAVELRLAKGILDAGHAADELDKLLYAWRGDQHERALRERLAELRARSGAWRSGLSLLRETETLFPEDKAAIRSELQDMFAALLRQDAVDRLPPLELVSLVEENTDLLPDGLDAEALEARLADRLLALDLPKRAGPVLEKLAQAAPSEVGRAGFGARLAALRLREGDAPGALTALSGSEASNLPAELAEKRVLLLAAATARRGDNSRALSALDNLNSAAADEARATILERASDWPAAQRALAAYAGKTVPPDGRLDDMQRRTLLRLATAAARSGDEVALTALREKEGARMGSGPLADMFRLLTADQVRSVADLKRSSQETALARALPAQLKALRPATGAQSP